MNITIKCEGRIFRLIKEQLMIIDKLESITTLDITDWENQISIQSLIRTDLMNIWKLLYFGVPRDTTAIFVTEKAYKLSIIKKEDKTEFKNYLEGK